MRGCEHSSGRDFFDLAVPDDGLSLPAELAKVDEMLEHSGLAVRVEAEMNKRWKHSADKGRKSIPAECYLGLDRTQRLKESYVKLMEIAKDVVRQAEQYAKEIDE